jgi:hypothetical protein
MEQPYYRNDGLSYNLARMLNLPLEQEEIRASDIESARGVAQHAAIAELGFEGTTYGQRRELELAHMDALSELQRQGVFGSLSEAAAVAFPPKDEIVLAPPSRGRKIAAALGRLRA